ncbi:MFS transporter [Salinactinospora qingdaonensis]|uniref:MFS transporter n=2 Tax=Salinactinospora qingdaonensis TaxID=702744 RepID=A0ABP7FAJ1_9ACTN
MFAVLTRNRTYRQLFTAQVCALVGTGLATVALGLLAFDIAGGHAARVVATALTIKMIAYVTAGPVMIALTIRLPRRLVLVSADAVRGLAVGLLPWVSEVWQIYALVAIVQTASATFTPTFQAVIPEVMDDDNDYTAALALSRMAYDLEAMASPLLAAALLAVLPFSGLFALTVAGFAVSALLVLRTRLPAVAPSGPSRWSAITAGTATFARDRRLRALVLLNFAAAVTTALVLVNTVVYVRGPIGGSSSDVALALACFGAGSMAVAFALPRLFTRLRVRTVLLAGPVVLCGGSAALTLGWALWPASGVVLGLGWLVLGAGGSLIAVPTGRLIKDAAGPTTRPALFAAQFAISHACFLVTYPLSGWAGTQASPVVAFAGAAVLTGLCAVGAPLLWHAGRKSTAATAPHVREGAIA